MLYLIDGTNIIYKSSTIRKNIKKDYFTACKMLVNQVRGFSAVYPSNYYEIYFDGFPNDDFSSPGKIKIVFSNSKTADDLIKQRIKTNYLKELMILVSSDIELMNYAKIHSISSIESKDFLQITNEPEKKFKQKRANQKSEKPSSTSRKEYNEMLKLFTESE